MGICRLGAGFDLSFARVTFVQPLRVNSRITIPAGELKFSFVRSSGPGGQNVNKVNSKAQLRWSVTASTALPDDVRARLSARLARRLTERGELVLVEPALPGSGPQYWRLFDQAARNDSSGGRTAKTT